MQETQDNKLTEMAIHKELDLIQGYISRMGHNSFLVKGWALTLFTFFIGFTQKDNANTLALGAFLGVIIAFWILDAFYLWTENRFCKLYEKVLVLRASGNASNLYDLNPNRFNKSVCGIFRTSISPTLLAFYGILTLINVGLILFRLYQK